MKKEQTKAEGLLNLEKALNDIEYFNMPIGGLLAFQFEQINKNKKPSIGLLSMVVLKNILQNLVLGTTSTILLSGKFIISKQGSAAHYNRMMDPLIAKWKKNAIIFQSKEMPVSSFRIDTVHFQDAVRLSTRSQWKVLIWWLKEKKKINQIIHAAVIDTQYKQSLQLDLLVQLCKLQFWKDAFKQECPAKVITDYDRGNHTAPLILVAKYNNITTYVIQHGVINPPYGFMPLLADHVCVWGDIQKKQYLEAGEKGEKIHITGTPIMEPVVRNDKERGAIKKKYDFDVERKQIALGINPIESAKLKRFIDDFIFCVSDIEDIEPIIKLHPAQNISYIQSICKIPDNIRLIDKNISNDDFFKFIDGLIIDNSGLGMEATQYGIPVAVYSSNSGSPYGNGKVMIDNLLATEIKSVVEMSDWINELKINEYSTTLKGAKNKACYYLTGTEAVNEIIKVIEHE